MAGAPMNEHLDQLNRAMIELLEEDHWSFPERTFLLRVEELSRREASKRALSKELLSTLLDFLDAEIRRRTEQLPPPPSNPLQPPGAPSGDESLPPGAADAQKASVGGAAKESGARASVSVERQEVREGGVGVLISAVHQSPKRLNQLARRAAEQHDVPTPHVTGEPPILLAVGERLALDLTALERARGQEARLQVGVGRGGDQEVAAARHGGLRYLARAEIQDKSGSRGGFTRNFM